MVGSIRDEKTEPVVLLEHQRTNASQGDVEVAKPVPTVQKVDYSGMFSPWASGSLKALLLPRPTPCAPPVRMADLDDEVGPDLSCLRLER